MKAFRREFERLNHSDELENDITNHLKVIASTKVTMLTVSDLDFVWFIHRMFAWTSSSVHATLRYAAPMILQVDEIYNRFVDLFDYAGWSQLLRGVYDDEDADDTGTSAESESDSYDIMTGEFVHLTIKLIRTLQSDEEEVISTITGE